MKLDKEPIPIPRKRVLELAKQALADEGDYPRMFMYDMATLADGSGWDVSGELAKLREEHFKRLGKKPPKLEAFD